MTSSIKRKLGMAEAIAKISKGSRVFATVIELLGDRATVRLTGGARLSNLAITGGTISVGEKVLIEWDGVEPYIRANSPASTESSVSYVSLGSHTGGLESDPLTRAGWVIDMDGIISTSETQIYPTGKITLGDNDPAGSILILDGEDTTYRIWAGNETAGSAPFSVTKLGAINSTLGNIGGWTIGATSLYSGTGATRVAMDSGGTNPAFYAGSETPASAPFRVTGAGVLTASNATITGSITASSGSIGGWNIGTYTITADSGSVGLNSEVGGDNWRIWAGSATPGSAPFRVNADGDVWLESATISADLQSANFLSGYSGWQILQDGSAEFNNIVVRGELLTTIFKYNEIAAIAGDLGVFKGGGKLTRELTTIAPPTGFVVYYEGSTLEVNDIVRIKDGFYDNWCIVITVAGGEVYAFELKYGTPTTFAEGITVVNYGPSGSGGILLTANQTNAPYMDIFTHAGEPWTTMTPKTRVGKLDTSLDATLLPTGYGLYSDNAYLKGKLVSGYFSIDPDNGLRITAADTYYPERAINIVYGSTTVGVIKQKVDTSAVVNEMTISVEPYTNRHSSIDMSCMSPGSSYASTFSLSVSQDMVGAIYFQMQKFSTYNWAKLTGGGLMLGDLSNWTIAEGSLDMTGDLRLAGGIYVGSAAGTVLDNGILASGDIRTSGGLSVGSITNNPSAGHLYTTYDIRCGSGLYVGDSTLASDPAAGNIVATHVITAKDTAYIRSGSGLYVGNSLAGDPGTGNIVATGNITTTSGTVTAAIVNATTNYRRNGTTGYIYVPFLDYYQYGENSLTGSNFSGVDFSISAAGVPSTAKAVSISLFVRGVTTSWMSLGPGPSGGGTTRYYHMSCVSIDGTKHNCNSAVFPTRSTDGRYITYTYDAVGGTLYYYIRVLGYFI